MFVPFQDVNVKALEQLSSQVYCLLDCFDYYLMLQYKIEIYLVEYTVVANETSYIVYTEMSCYV